MADGVLHIGVEKTGSTSIQISLSRSRHQLLARGVLYPEALGERNQVKAYAYASETGVDELKSQWGLDNPAAVDRFRSRVEDQLMQEIAAKKPRVVCVSNEHCSSRLLLSSEIERLKALLERHCNQVKVVVYLRRQGSALQSAYSTYVKTGGVAPFEPPDLDVVVRKYDYDVILTRWASVFGEENMDVRIFDRECLDDGDVVTDFFARIGVDTGGLNLEREMNKSLGYIGMEFLRQFNLHVPYTLDSDFNPLRGNIQDIVEELVDDVAFEGDADVMNAFDRAMAESNERVKARYFPDLAGPLFGPPSPRPAGAERREVTSDDLMTVMAHVWEAKQRQVIRMRNRLEKIGNPK